MRRFTLACGALLWLVLPGRAELMIESAGWQLARPIPGQQPVYQGLETLPTAPPRLVGKLRLRVVLKNRGPLEAEGIVLRYALTARLARREKTEAGAGRKEVRPSGTGGTSDTAGVWAVPFLISEQRVPKVGPNQLLAVTWDPSGSVSLPLSHYLKRMFDSGFWPDQLKLQIMLSPHPGAVEAIRTQEFILPVAKE